MSKMSDPPESGRSRSESIVLAGEIALGLTSDSEIHRHRALAHEIARWNDDLAKLADELEAVTPPARVWAEISQKMQATSWRARPWPNWSKSIEFRRVVAVASIALGIILAVLLTETMRSLYLTKPQTQTLLVGFLSPKEGPPLYTLIYQPERGTLIIIPVTIHTQPGRFAQLWLVPTSTDEPIPLAALDGERPSVTTIPTEKGAQINKDSGLIVTSEPAGEQSPVSSAGPVIAHGRFVNIEAALSQNPP
jgi:anti-sigma-K factor RskA